MFMLSTLFFASCNKKGEFDSHPPAVNKEDFKLSTSQSGKDTLYVTNKEDFKLHAVELLNKADRKLLCRVNLNDVKNTKLEAEGVTYGEVKYTGGEASIIKINNWGTIEKTTIARHKKSLCYGLYWQKTLGYRINSLCCRSEWWHSCNR